MTTKEQETADLLLDKIKAAPADEVNRYASAYQSLVQGALSRDSMDAKISANAVKAGLTP